MDGTALKTTIYNFLLELESEDGINASGKEEIFGCIFGRDSAITILKILKAVSCPHFSKSAERHRLLQMCRKTLLTLTRLQGLQVNIESGEEPGKFIHEYRKERYEHLSQSESPWYVYPEGVLKNYDSIDATPLVLIAIYRYWKITGEDAFLLSVLDSVEKGLDWIMDYGDSDGDYLIEYTFNAKRKFGGLSVQSWTDSRESLTDTFGNMPTYPISPVEAQGYAWLAIRLWEEYYSSHQGSSPKSKKLVKKLSVFSQNMKKSFNNLFVIQDNGLSYAAQALDGNKRQISVVTANPLLLLWASLTKDSERESIIKTEFIPDLVKRGFASDLFDPDGGVRTMSMLSPTFNPNQDSYHNGSFWPMLNGLVYEGFLNWGFYEEAKMLKKATLSAFSYFGTPIELYTKNEMGQLLEYRNKAGQTSCRNQAWSAAAILVMLNLQEDEASHAQH